MLRDKNKKVEMAKELKIKFDERSRLQVILDLKKENKTAYAVIFPNLFSKFFKEINLMPLSGISNSLTVYGNETGKFLIYESDRYGFNNSDYIYDQDVIDYLIIGDSYAHGAGVVMGEDVASVLRKKGYNAITIGMGGNGPLAELASLIEYGVKFKPKNILWFHYSNDLINLVEELQNPILKKYITDENFSQNLINKQSELDQILKEFHENKIKEYQNIHKIKKNRFIRIKNDFPNHPHIPTIFFSKNNLRKIFTLYRIRTLLKIDKSAFREENKINIEIKENFKKIFFKACKIADKNYSQFYLVNLPSFKTLADGKTYNNNFTEDFIKNFFVKKINFGSFLLSRKNFKSFFPFEMHGHYTKEGYEELAKIILDNTSKKDTDNCNYNKYSISMNFKE